MVELKKEQVYFYMNGHNFHISTDSSTESEINLVINRMHVPDKAWGYNNIQWTNFSGEKISLTVYNRIDDEYTGEKAQPVYGEVTGVYEEEKFRAFHALKFWGQNFVPVKIKTNIPAFESGTYAIKTFKQSSPVFDFIVSEMELIQYEKPSEIHQSYGLIGESLDMDTSYLTAGYTSISDLNLHKQTCDCNEFTPAIQCTAYEEEDVKTIQQNLQDWGYFPTYTKDSKKIEPNGKYCYNTTQAIKKFQKKMGIPVSGDFTEETRKAFLKKMMEQ